MDWTEFERGSLFLIADSGKSSMMTDFLGGIFMAIALEFIDSRRGNLEVFFGNLGEQRGELRVRAQIRSETNGGAGMGSGLFF